MITLRHSNMASWEIHHFYGGVDGTIRQTWKILIINIYIYMGMDQYLLIPFLVGWTSINPSYIGCEDITSKIEIQWWKTYGYQVAIMSMGIPGSKNGGTVPYKALFCWDIPLHRPYIGLIYARYLQFRILKWPLIMRIPWTKKQKTPVFWSTNLFCHGVLCPTCCVGNRLGKISGEPIHPTAWSIAIPDWNDD